MQHGPELCWEFKSCSVFKPVCWVVVSTQEKLVLKVQTQLLCWPRSLGVISYAKGCAETKLRILLWKMDSDKGARSSAFRQNLCAFPFIYFFIYLSIARLIWPVCLADGIFFGRPSCHGYGCRPLSWWGQTYRGILPALVLHVSPPPPLPKFLYRTPCLSAVTLSSFGHLPLRLGFTSFPTVYGWDRFHLIYRETLWYHHRDQHSESSLYLFIICLSWNGPSALGFHFIQKWSSGQIRRLHFEGINLGKTLLLYWLIFIFFTF